MANSTTTYNYPSMEIYRSFATTDKKYVTPAGPGKFIKYGDNIFVRLTQRQWGVKTIAEFTINDVNDLSEIYGELRRHTRGYKGLTQLYVRNLNRGWSIQQPFMLYSDKKTVSAKTQMASSVSHPVRHPDNVNKNTRRQIPESIRLRYSM